MQNCNGIDFRFPPVLTISRFNRPIAHYQLHLWGDAWWCGCPEACRGVAWWVTMGWRVDLSEPYDQLADVYRKPSNRSHSPFTAQLIVSWYLYTGGIDCLSLCKLRCWNWCKTFSLYTTSTLVWLSCTFLLEKAALLGPWLLVFLLVVLDELE